MNYQNTHKKLTFSNYKKAPDKVGFEDSEIFFYFSTERYVVAPHYNRLSKMVVITGHNKFLWKNMENYLCYPFLSVTLL